MPIVECNGITKTYHQGKIRVEALRGIDICIPKGSFLAIAGPSGSGKTTLLNIIGSLDAPDDGRVKVDGKSLCDMTQAQAADMRLHKIGFVFQAYNLIPVLSALENVEYVMLLQGVASDERRRRARDILNDVGLGDTYDRRPAELSGGQQQRVAIARAIVSDPAVVLADEPTANLDSQTGGELLELMKQMNEQKAVTFVFSTHDEMVMDYATRLVTIRDGRIADDLSK